MTIPFASSNRRPAWQKKTAGKNSGRHGSFYMVVSLVWVSGRRRLGIRWYLAAADSGAWDPVETASFIPWLTLTAFLHAAPALAQEEQDYISIAAHRNLRSLIHTGYFYARNCCQERLLIPVHAFGDSSTGTLLLVFYREYTTLCIHHTWIAAYFEETDIVEEDRGFWNKTQCLLTLHCFYSWCWLFISFWGISFARIHSAYTGTKE